MGKRNHIFHIAPAYSIANDIHDDCHYIIISSGNSYDVLSELNNVSVLHFADTEIGTRSDAFSTTDAQTIFAFLDTCLNEDVFISCDEGVSRSPAVAAGLLRASGQNDDYIWLSKEYRPNVYIYSMLLESCCSEKEFEKEIEILNSQSPESYREYRKTLR